MILDGTCNGLHTRGEQRRLVENNLCIRRIRSRCKTSLPRLFSFGNIAAMKVAKGKKRMKEIERDFVGERCCHWDLGSERERERRANGVGYIAFLFMAVCPNPLPGLLPADGLLSFIISCSFSFFSSSSGFFYLSLSSLPSLCRLVAHFELAAAAA